MENQQDAIKAAIIGPRGILRLEGLVWFCLFLALFYGFSGAWWLFALCFFIPDLSLLAYGLGPRTGALIYNLFHTEIWAVILILACFFVGQARLFDLGLIWLCHVNFDRMLGIGLKYSDSFVHTHLGFLTFGRKRSQ